ncbi:hypothetical protein [Povalibacter sp.]|uniref:hypothetical protein n=1 Tax=Povalibacter sp. TaxID=1962978 RepID=UPI002F41647A
MFAFTVTSRKVQNAICMMLSAVIVSASLSLGALATEYAEHNAYAVTVTQLS